MSFRVRFPLTAVLGLLLVAACADEPVTPGDGGAGTPTARIEATEVAFGQVDCGEKATREVVIENQGDGLLTFTTSVTGARFSATPAEGSVPAGEKASVTVTATLPAAVAAGSASSGVLTIVTNDVKKATSTLNLSAQSSGATLSLMPSVASFGVLPVQTATPPLPLTLRNDGNVPATLAFTQPSDGQFVLTWAGAPRPVTVDPGQTVPGLAAVFSPTVITPAASSAGIFNATAVCGASVASIPLTGQGTSGAVSLSTTDVFFGDNGLVDCGTQASPRSFKLSNTGNQAFAWTAKLGQGDASPFTFAPLNGLVPANGGEVEITVTPKAVPSVAGTEANGFGDVLTIFTDVPGLEPQTVTLHQTARGAALRFATAALDFGLVPTFDSAPLAFSLVNDGNVSVDATVNSTNPLFEVTPAQAHVEGAASSELVAVFTPGASIEPQQSEVSVSVDAALVLCAPLPEPMSLSGTGLGSPRARFSSDELAFEYVGCGESRSKILTLANDGEVPLTFAATVDGKRFSVLPAEGSVPPGEIVDLVIEAAFPSSATAGTAAAGTLTLATNDESFLSTLIDLSAVSSGATLILSQQKVSFGLRPLAVPVDPVGVELKNTGNAAAVVAFDQPADPQFSVSWAGSPAAVSVEPGATLPDLAAGFTPSTATASQTETLIRVEGAVCGESASSLSLSGQGSGGTVGFSTTEVFFGDGGFVDCGAQSPSRTFHILNTGNQAFSWTATLGKGAGSPFAFSPESGTVPAGGSQEITVTAAAIPQTASTEPDAFGDTLIFDTDVRNDPDHVIVLHQTARGAVLRFATATVAFGDVPTYETATQPLSFVNEGNAPATVSLASTSELFSVAAATGLEVEGGGSMEIEATFSPNGSVVTETADVSMALASPAVLCAPLPAPAALSGTGTLGVVEISAEQVDFGEVSCGTTAEARQIVFSNPGNQDYTLTAALGREDESPFAVTLDPASGVVAANGGTLTLTVTPEAIPQVSAVTPNLYGDMLRVTTDVPNDEPHDIPLLQTASGSIFVINATMLNFGSVPKGTSGTAQFSVSNNGNARGGLTFTTPPEDVFTFADVTFDGMSSGAVVGQFSPTGLGTFTSQAAIDVVPGTVLCQPLPRTSLDLTGKGTNENVIAVNTSSLTFGTATGLVDCGTQAASRSLSVINHSNEMVTVSALLGRSVNSPFTVDPIADIPKSEERIVTVRPKAIPQTASTVTDAFGDTLILTFVGSGGLVEEQHVVNLHQTARGAVLAFNPTVLSFVAKWSQSTTKSFTLSNTGNLAATYLLALGGSSAGDYSVTPVGGTVAAADSALGDVKFSVAFLSPGGARPGSLSVTVPSGTTLCAPLPTPITLSGTAQAKL